MHDALAMGVLERVAENDADTDDVLIGELPGFQQMVEGGAPHQLGDQIGALVVHRGLVQGDDARMRQARGHSRLAFEPAPHDPLAGKYLDRHVALEAFVAGLPDGPEGARAQAPIQPVAVEDQGRRRHLLATSVRSPGGAGAGVPAVGRRGLVSGRRPRVVRRRPWGGGRRRAVGGGGLLTGHPGLTGTHGQPFAAASRVPAPPSPARARLNLLPARLRAGSSSRPFGHTAPFTRR